MIRRKEVRSLGGTAQNELAAPRNSPAAATLALMLSPAARPTVLVKPWLKKMSSRHMTALRTVAEAENLSNATGAEATDRTVPQAMNAMPTRKFLATTSIG